MRSILKHHLIVTHEVTNVGSDRSQLSRMSEQARAAIGSEAIEAIADRGYYNGEEIVACEQAGITVYLPKPMTSGLLAKGRFGKQDFVYVVADDVYLRMTRGRCGSLLLHRDGLAPSTPCRSPGALRSPLSQADIIRPGRLVRFGHVICANKKSSDISTNDGIWKVTDEGRAYLCSLN